MFESRTEHERKRCHFYSVCYVINTTSAIGSQAELAISPSGLHHVRHPSLDHLMISRDTVSLIH